MSAQEQSFTGATISVEAQRCEEKERGYYERYQEEMMRRCKYARSQEVKFTEAKKIVLDCDPGGDDAQALILAFHLARLQGIEILGITTVAGNATLEHVVYNTQMTLDVCNEKDIPIFRGEEPWKKGACLSEYFWGADGFGQALFEEQQNKEIKLTNLKEESAVDFLLRITKEQPGEITLICLAPLSNLHAAFNKDPEFPARVKNVVMMGGTYLAQGNTDLFCSEFNFFKDPDAAACVFDNFKDLTLIPLEATYFQRKLPKELNWKPYQQLGSPKGRLVHAAYRVAFINMVDHYETCDPLAVAVALKPDIVEEAIQKCCYIETEGAVTRGAVIVDWFERYPVVPRAPVKIVTRIDGHQLVELMTQSVL